MPPAPAAGRPLHCDTAKVQVSSPMVGQVRRPVPVGWGQELPGGLAGPSDRLRGCVCKVTGGSAGTGRGTIAQSVPP